MKNIPLSALKGACKDQMKLVRKHWPKGIPVTEESATLAAKLGLDLAWAANRLLSAPAWADYQKATAPAWAEYQKAIAPALLQALKTEGGLK